MSSENRMPFAQLILRIREELGKKWGLNGPISQEQLAVMLGVSKRTIIRWENGETENLTLDMCVKLANVSGKSAQVIALILGHQEFSVPPVDIMKLHHSLRVAPLAEWPSQNLDILNSVKHALNARQVYCLEGDLQKAARLYTYAIAAAKRANANLLECYLIGYLGNIYEMLGGISLSDAQRILDDGEHLAERLAKTAMRDRDTVVEFIAKRLLAITQLRKGWVLWAKNDYIGAIALAESLRHTFSDLRLYRKRIYLNELLARCSAGLGQFAAARMYIDEAVVFAYSLPHMPYQEYDFFLEPGVGYEWSLDQILTAKMDVFIAQDAIDEAFETYQRIHKQLEPAATISAHEWFRFSWQQRLRKEMEKGTISGDTDYKLDVSFEEWDAYMAEGGDTHVRARLAYSQGDYELASGNAQQAIIYYQQSSALAHRARAEAVEVLSLLACANAYLRLANKEEAKAKAIQILITIEPILHRLNNPMLQETFRRTQEAVREH